MPRPTRPAAKPKPKSPSVRKPNGVNDHDVAKRAYEIFESRGAAHDFALEHCLEAERELRKGVTVPAKPKKAKAPQAGV